MNKKYNYQIVYNFFKTEGCQLLSFEYKNVDTPLLFICSCGNTHKRPFKEFKKGKKCAECGYKLTGNKLKKSYEEVNKIFKDAGCTLLSEEYKSSSQKLKYICNCGREDVKTLKKFQKGQRCWDCGREKVAEASRNRKYPERRRENHHNWKKEKTDEERLADRKYREYHEWRNKVFQRDDYKCQCCGQVGQELTAHHLNGYSWDFENRLNLDNGITLCQSCHNLYHFQFGKQDTVIDDFLYFLEGISWHIEYQILTE